MKIPCEVMVWQVLPLVRRELARELVRTHGITQAEVAKRFDVTDAAISQYLTNKRGGEYSSAPMYPEFLEAVRRSAARMADGTSTYDREVCQLCSVVKRSGLLAVIYKHQTGVYPPEVCGSSDRMKSE